MDLEATNPWEEEVKNWPPEDWDTVRRLRDVLVFHWEGQYLKHLAYISAKKLSSLAMVKERRLRSGKVDPSFPTTRYFLKYGVLGHYGVPLVGHNLGYRIAKDEDDMIVYAERLRNIIDGISLREYMVGDAWQRWRTNEAY